MQKTKNDLFAFYAIPVSSYDGPVLVSSDGENPVLSVFLHRVRYLSSSCSGNDRIAVVAAGDFLIRYLSRKLKALCTEDEMKYVSLLNLTQLEHESGRDSQAKAGTDSQIKAGRDLQAEIGRDSQAKAGADSQAEAGTESQAEIGRDSQVEAGPGADGGSGLDPGIKHLLAYGIQELDADSLRLIGSFSAGEGKDALFLAACASDEELAGLKERLQEAGIMTAGREFRL